MVAPTTPISHASVLERHWIQLELPENPYDDTFVGNAASYRVICPADPAFAVGMQPSAVFHRHAPESAWYNDDPALRSVARIQVMYRIFLCLPQSLTEHVPCIVAMEPGVVRDARPLPFTFDADAPSDAIHVNQVAFVANGPKEGFISLWTGQGSISFDDAKTFELIDRATHRTVLTGPIRLCIRSSEDLWSKSNVYAFDFSEWSTPGSYFVRVPGVGSSYPFSVGGDDLAHIVYTLARGLTHQRDGRHGLDSPRVTRWTRPAAHLDDAIEESTGKRIDLVGGHMDAGDRGKYPHNSADAAGSMLAGAILFPEAVERIGETLQIPESGNGIPDWLDEVVYELDFLAKVVLHTTKEGTVPFYLRPRGGGYEFGRGPEGETGRVLYDATQGPYRAETLYVAGVLAMACNTPLLRKHVHDKLVRWRFAALRAFAAFEAHVDDLSYWKNDKHSYDLCTGGAHPWSDEMLVAAANLYQLTGEPKYLSWLVQEMPTNPSAVRHYGWSLEGPWLNAFLSIARISRPGLPPSIRESARLAIVSWGDEASSHDGVPYARPYGMPLPTPVRTRVGWFFSSSQTAFPLMLAYGVTGNERYLNDLLRAWNYLLGGNPLNRTWVSGLGQADRRPRWVVHEIAHEQWRRYRHNDPSGWSEIVPGIPAADIQSGEYGSRYDDSWNKSRRDAWFPPRADFSPLHRSSDGWMTNAEFTIDRMARGATSALALAMPSRPSAFAKGEPIPDFPAVSSPIPRSPDAKPARGCGCGPQTPTSSLPWAACTGLCSFAWIVVLKRKSAGRRT